MISTSRLMAREFAQKCKFNTPERCADVIYDAIVLSRKGALLGAADRFDRIDDDYSGHYVADVLRGLAEEIE